MQPFLLLLCCVAWVWADALPKVQLPWGTYQADSYDSDGDVSPSNASSLLKIVC